MRALLFTDIEGSTALLQRIGLRYTALLRRHQIITLDAASSHGGTIEREDGDGLFVTFASPSAAIAAAAAAQVQLQREPWPGDAWVRVRMGVHVGEIADTSAGLVGLPIHQAARIAAVAQGDQILVSDAARWLADDIAEPPRVAQPRRALASRPWPRRCSSGHTPRAARHLPRSHRIRVDGAGHPYP